MPVTAPADRRFLRGQARPGRRRRAWRRPLAFAVRVFVAAAVFGGAAYLVGATAQASGLLLVRRIDVRGVERLSPGEVRSLLEGLRGRDILSADLAAYRSRLLESPWVADAVLRRRLPSTVEVLIAERRPIGLARLRGALYLMDEQGGIVEEFGPKHAALDLPVVDGLGSSGPGDGGSTGDPRVDLAVRVLNSLGERPALFELVSQVDVSNPRDASVILAGDTVRLRLGDTQFGDRLQAYLELAPRLRERVPGIDYVDLRFGDRVYVGTKERP